MLGVFAFLPSIKSLYFAHIFLDVARRNDRCRESYALFFIIDVGKDNGYLSFQCDVVKAQLPVGIGFAGCFGGDGDGKPFAPGETLGQLVGKRGGSSPVYGNTPHGSEQVAKREEEPLFFHQKSGFTAQCPISQFAPDEVPVAGVRGYTYYAFRIVGHRDFHAPPGHA